VTASAITEGYAPREPTIAAMRTDTTDREAFDFFRALVIALPIGLGLWAIAVAGLLALR